MLYIMAWHAAALLTGMSAITGYDVRGIAKKRCAPMRPTTVCTQTFGPPEEFAEECKRRGFTVTMCGCHKYMCSQPVRLATDSEKSAEPRKDSAGDPPRTGEEVCAEPGIHCFRPPCPAVSAKTYGSAKEAEAAGARMVHKGACRN